MKVLFVINPRSGRKEQDELDVLISATVEEMKLDHRVFLMKSGDQTENIRKEIKSYGPEIVACAGGDGTVNLMAELLADSAIALLILPFGSANGMAKELGVGNSLEESIGLLKTGIRKRIDLLVINGHICIHLADVGLNARIVKRFEKDPKRGKAIYAKHLLGEIFLIKQYRFFITHDDREIWRKAVSLTFANASKYGTGAVINPDGKVDDGFFELVIVKPFPLIKILSIGWKMFTGNLRTSEYVEVIKCKKAGVRTYRKTTLQVDGEVLGKVSEINIGIKPKALDVMVPADFK